MDWVVKVGGSLFPEKAIELCESIMALNNSARSPKKIVFICGGGSFANKIRIYDHDMHFSNTANHNSAIMCMDIIGTLLADKVEGLEVAKSIDSVKSILNHGSLPVLIPSKIFESHDPFEHSWRVSSDSLSMYISDLLKAKLLIATDVDGIYTHDPSHDDAKLIKFISAKKLLNFGETSVDEFLPELLIRYNSNCYVVNGKYPDRVISIIEGKSSKYTLIGGN
ncbi:MAG: delta 1-pyrroline-5-carboxylate synthetase [Methanobacterium sp.]